jgi:predicted Zn-dependent protease
LGSCNSQTHRKNSFSDQLFSDSDYLNILIGYETKALPYPDYQDTSAWVFVQESLSKLLSSKSISVNTYSNPSEMTSFGWITERNYSNKDILNLAKRIKIKKGNSPTIKVVFLNGYYKKDGKIFPDVLGLNINNTPIVAIFKPVIKKASKDLSIQALVEQHTITHEIGHAIGLVNNNVAQQTLHLENKNGAHCTNSNCVMHWENNDNRAINLLSSKSSSVDYNLFGNCCMLDVKEK